jgi:hypothetical protein
MHPYSCAFWGYISFFIYDAVNKKIVKIIDNKKIEEKITVENFK